jgi:hypothetical protein
MSDGFHCAYCGHYEATHEDPSLLDETAFYLPRPGYEFAISGCPGFALNAHDQRLMAEMRSRDADAALIRISTGRIQI